MAEAGQFEMRVAEVEKLLENSGVEQEKLLQHFIEKHLECEYLKKYDVKDAKSFKDLVPVIEYDAIEQDVERIVNGDTSHILCCSKIEELFLSSGTIGGKRKALPVTDSLLSVNSTSRDRANDIMRVSSFRNAAASGLVLSFVCLTKEKRSPGGLIMTSSTTSMYRNTVILDKVISRWTSPVEVIQCRDYNQAVYCQLLCGLLRRSQVTNFRAVFAAGFVAAITLLRQIWEEMCTVLETGQLGDRITDPAVRAGVSKLLTCPNHELAELIRAECSQDSWEGILLRLWPNAKFIACVATGTMIQYVGYIDFLSGGQLPILSNMYGGSEGFYGINPCLSDPPSQVFYVLMPDLIYFEFLKIEEEIQVLPNNTNQEKAQVVDLANVEQGQKYAMLVTNGSGLWRYRVGDVLKCVGFYHKAPKFQYVARENCILSISVDKTDETELQQAVEKAAKLHLPADVLLLDFTSTVCLASAPGWYTIFWEVTRTGTGPAKVVLSDETLQGSCLTVEKALAEPYRRERNHGVIGPLEIRIVEPGTFAKISLLARSQGTFIAQYKTPRSFKHGNPALAILNDSVTQTASSNRPPFHPQLNPAQSIA